MSRYIPLGITIVNPNTYCRKVAAQAAQLEAKARQESQTEKAEENKPESENAPSSIEESSESDANSASNNDSGISNPFAQRVTNRFNPSSSIFGNLLDIMSG